MNKFIYLVTCWFVTLPVWAKDIIQVAQKIERNGEKLALQVAIIGVLLASFSFILGKHDASEKLVKALIGTFLAVAAGAIVATIKAWV